MGTYKNYIIETMRDCASNQCTNLSKQFKSAKLATGDFLLTKARKITVVVSYPLDGEFEFTLTSPKGFTKQIFYEKLRELYSNVIYRKPTVYGIWGHSIKDLVLESVSIRKNGKFYPYIGS